MSYADGYLTINHPLATADLGAGANTTTEIVAPPGVQRGRIKDMGLLVTEVFADDLTEASVDLGDGSDADRYASLKITDGTAAGKVFTIVDDPDAIIEADIVVSDLTNRELVVTYVQGTDGTAVTGQGTPYVTIDWF
jgi:hypothetical protein